jgi:formylglycine-generating enzyme required for sulfatase activity
MHRPAAAILSLVVTACNPASAQCAADLNGDGLVSGADIGILLGAWGPCITGPPTCRGDLDRNGTVNGSDLGLLLGAWGQCPDVPGWATLLEAEPDPAVVTSASLRASIRATGLAWRVRDASTQVEMVLVPGGSFQRGCSASLQQPCLPDELPTRPITISAPFYLSRRELTQSQWRAVMGDNPSVFQGASYPEDLHPVDSLSWNRAAEFIARTGMRFPTEAEWEFAYRAGTTTAFHGYAGMPAGTNGDGFASAIAWHDGNSFFSTQRVGTKLPNGLGLHDMSGNVSEYCGDWYDADYFAACPAEDPPGPASGTYRVMRGGAHNEEAKDMRSSSRGGGLPGSSMYGAGLRVARDP